MALEEQTVELPFSGGTKDGEEPLLQTEGWQLVENCARTKDGGFRKLQGFVQQATAIQTLDPDDVSSISVPSYAATLSNPRAITLGRSVAYASKGTLWAADPLGSTLSAQGFVSPWVADISTVQSLESTDRFDCCYSGSIVYHVTVENEGFSTNSLHVVARDVNGATLYESVIEATVMIRGPRVLAWTNTDSTALVLFRDGTDLRWVAITDGRYQGVGGTIAAGLPGDFPFDACIDSVTKLVFVVFQTSSINVQVQTLNGASGTSLVFTGSVNASCATPTAVSIEHNPSNGRLLLSIADWTGASPTAAYRVRCFVLTHSPLVALGPSVTVFQSFSTGTITSNYDAVIKQMSACVIANNLWYLVISDPNHDFRGGEFSPDVQCVRGRVIAADGSSIGSATDTTYSVRMCSRVYYDSTAGRVYFLAHSAQNGGTGADNDTNRAAFIMAHPGLGDTIATYGDGRFVPLGHFGYGTAQVYKRESGLNNTGYIEQLASWYTVQGVLHFAYRDEENGVVRIRDVALSSDARTGVHVQFGAQAYIAGAMLWQWDGWRSIEAQFLQNPYLAGPAYAAGALASGTRYYKITFLRVSQTGEQVRSRPSDSVAYTNGVGQLNALSWNRINVTAAQARGRFEEFFYEIWRTKNGQTSPFYLVARIPAEQYPGVGAPIDPYSIGVGENVSYNDEAADTALLSVALAPDGSAGAELANDPPPSAVHLCRWQNRLWVTDGERIWYSKERAADRAAEFAFSQSMERGALQGRVVALARGGETLSVFSRDETGYIYGDAPAANGEGSTLTGPVLSQARIGCLYPAALCDIPQGTLVPTEFGLQLYTLGREYQYVGADAEDSLSFGTELTSAVYEQASDLVWIAATDKFVLLDTQRMQWSTAFTATNPISVALAGSNLVMTTASAVYSREGAAYAFGGAFYAQQVETPWFKAGGVLGEMRARKLWLLAQYRGSSGVRVEVAYDFNETWTESCDLSHADIVNTELSHIRVVRLPMPRQRCRAFKLRITETEGVAADTEGFAFLALRLSFANRGVRGTALKESNSGSGLR